MRIREVRVFGLFDLFDHTITLNQTDRVTIVHGPNGYGKTAVLRLLRALFKCDYEHLWTTPFKAMEIDLVDGQTLRVEHDPTPLKDFETPRPRLRVQLRAASGVTHAWIGPRDGSQAISRFFSSTPSAPTDPSDERDWRVGLALDVGFSIHFVDTQRLHRKIRGDRHRDEAPSVVESIAEELAATVAEQQAAYGRHSQELDRTFPRRLLRREATPVLSIKELHDGLGALEKRTQRLVAVGLLDRQDAASASVETIDEEGREILSIFVADSARKLAVFDDLLARLELLHDVIRMRRTQRSVEACLLVEGDTDRRLFEKVVDLARCAIEVCLNRSFALTVLAELAATRTPGVLALVDADFDRLSHVVRPANIVWTDTHDVETMLLRSPALDDVMREHGSTEKCDRFTTKHGPVREALLRAGRGLGYLRWHAHFVGLPLRFEDLDVAKFVDDALVADEDEACRVVCARSKLPPPQAAILRSLAGSLKEPWHDPWQVCCGHDLVEILGYALRKTLGSRSANDAKADVLEKDLRLAFDRRWFARTRLCEDIRACQAANIPYIILAADA